MERPAECLIHMRTTESVKFRALFETLNPILVEGSIEFNESGMMIRGLNQIALVDLIIRADDVEDYVCNSRQRVSINFNTLYTCLSSVGQDEAICFQITEAGINACVPYLAVFIINNSGGESYVFSYQVSLLALTEEKLDAIPSTNFQAVVSIPSVAFQRVLRCCEKRGDFVQITTQNQTKDKNFLVFVTEGDEASLVFHMRYQVDPKTWTGDSCIKQDLYSLKYLSQFTKATSLSSYVTLYLSDDFVLAIKYNIGTIGEITFCLAPRIAKSKFVPKPIIALDNIFGDDVLPESDSDDEEVEEQKKPKRKQSAKQKKQQQKAIQAKEAVMIEEEEEDVAEVKETEEVAGVKGGGKSAPDVKIRKMKMVDDGAKMKRKRRKRRRCPDDINKPDLLSNYAKKKTKEAALASPVLGGKTEAVDVPEVDVIATAIKQSNLEEVLKVPSMTYV